MGSATRRPAPGRRTAAQGRHASFGARPGTVASWLLLCDQQPAGRSSSSSQPARATAVTGASTGTAAGAATATTGLSGAIHTPLFLFSLLPNTFPKNALPRVFFCRSAAVPSCARGQSRIPLRCAGGRCVCKLQTRSSVVARDHVLRSLDCFSLYFQSKLLHLLLIARNSGSASFTPEKAENQAHPKPHPAHSKVNKSEIIPQQIRP